MKKDDIIIECGGNSINYSFLESTFYQKAKKYSFKKDHFFLRYLTDLCTLYCVDKFLSSEGEKYFFNFDWVLNTFLKTKCKVDFAKYEISYSNSQSYDNNFTRTADKKLQSESCEDIYIQKQLYKKLKDKYPSILKKSLTKKMKNDINKLIY